MTRREEADLLIVGGGFAGALMALVAHRLGLRPIVVEKGCHPRFAIGESSTPIANLVLEEIARTYDLPRLLPLCKYGPWQRAYPQLACGLKRGFTFVKHEPGRPFQPRPDHANELLVAASPHDEVGDTHWFRAHFDHFLIEEVRSAGIPYYDQTDITTLQRKDGWHLRGHRPGEELQLRANFLVDATGPAGLAARALDIEISANRLRTHSWSVYSHFVGVGLWQDVLVEQGGSVIDHPYACDNAALHHILEEGWVWVLRFNNGVTSAGIMFDGERHPADSHTDPATLWAEVLGRYPSLARQFSEARPVQPWVRTGRVQRCLRQAAGEDWACLAHAAYFLDPLFSSGNAHSLLTVERLARIFARHWKKTSLKAEIQAYDSSLLREVAFLDRLIHGCYRAFGCFDLLAPFTMYYFAAAIHSEEQRRKGLSGESDEVLFSHHKPFRDAVLNGYEQLLRASQARPVSAEEVRSFEQRVAEDIAPYNTVGLCDPSKNNMIPYG